MIKAKNEKNIFVLGVSKVLSEGVIKIFREKNFIGVSATKSWEKSRNNRYGLPEIFLVKGKNRMGGEGWGPGPYRVKCNGQDLYFSL